MGSGVGETVGDGEAFAVGGEAVATADVEGLGMGALGPGDPGGH